eukprot:11673760-Prorocentrum_lima.AAC.1
MAVALFLRHLSIIHACGGSTQQEEDIRRIGPSAPISRCPPSCSSSSSWFGVPFSSTASAVSVAGPLC